MADADLIWKSTISTTLRIVTGDLGEQVAALAEDAPRDATLVIFQSAVLAYLAPAERATTVGNLDAH